jgi:hypothetical protein
MNYTHKYLKYKKKYLELKYGGSKLNIPLLPNPFTTKLTTSTKSTKSTTPTTPTTPTTSTTPTTPDPTLITEKKTLDTEHRLTDHISQKNVGYYKGGGDFLFFKCFFINHLKSTYIFFYD